MLHKLLPRLALSACVAAGFAHTPARAETASTELRSELRAAMVDYINANSIDGKFYHLNQASGTLETYEPADVSAVVLKVGDHYVICSSFETADGKTVYLDFFAVQAQGKAEVLQLIAEKRDLTCKIVRARQAAAR
ncbi:hypothetical protein [Denitrobaculum tricleocarpae]|uniref:Uncharacterized protein n=1 Tax=Denitrobaculum tricleocarpae TaxID=2591009 RepID=A0A545TKU3_9PROT|nr:hypothetical protein [Denitrobaculum tricleocarpae]TQV77850.1 hypothetical protein FKG95_20065 [Denitrobaculum tricleocarpae]